MITTKLKLEKRKFKRGETS